MVETYRHIGDPDAIYGCGTNRLVHPVTRIKMYEEQENWTQAVGSYDLQMNLSSSDSRNRVGLLNALEKFGCAHLLDTYLGSLQNSPLSGCKEIKEMEYQAASRNCKWNLELPTRLDCESVGYDQIAYNCYVGLHLRDDNLVEAGILAARSFIVKNVNALNIESAKSLCPLLSKLQCITELQDIACTRFTDEGIDGVVGRWQQGGTVNSEYEHFQPILSQRVTLMQLAYQTNQSESTRRGLFLTLESQAKAARKAARYSVAEGVMTRMRQLSEGSSNTLPLTWKVEESKLYWARGELDTAKYMMRTLLRGLENNGCGTRSDGSGLYEKCLVLYGNWLAETRSENSTVIMKRYFNKVTKFMS